MNLSWLPGIIVALITGLISIVVAFTVVREKGSYLKEQEKKLEDHLANASKELQEAVKAIAILQREQSVINRMTAKTLESLTTKVEGIQSQLSEQNTTIRLLMETVKRLEKMNIE